LAINSAPNLSTCQGAPTGSSCHRRQFAPSAGLTTSRPVSRRPAIQAAQYGCRPQIVVLPDRLIHINALVLPADAFSAGSRSGGSDKLTAGSLRWIMARDDASLPALDANSADTLRASALRAYQFAWRISPTMPRTSSHSLPNLGKRRCAGNDDQAPQRSQTTDCEEVAVTAKKTA
jgi:hypothetical protein